MACISKAWFSSNIHRVKIISLTIFLYLISPLIFVSILMLQVVRKWVSVFAKVFRKDLSRLVSPCSSLLANDDLYGIPNHNTVVWFILKGRVSIDSLQSTIYEKVLNKTDSHGQLIYPQLREFPTHVYKYLFWKNDEDFKIENYIYLYDKAKDDNRSWGEEDLLSIARNITRKQWTRHRSPWEIFLIPNFRPTYRGEMKTVMFLRFHECLGDSFSWLQLFVTNLCDCDNEGGHHFPRFKADLEETVVPETNKVSVLTLKILFQRIIFPFKIPFVLAQQMMEPNDTSAWKVPDTKLIKRDHINIVDKFSVQHIKDIKNMLGTTYTAVIFAIVTSAIRTTLINLRIKIPREMKIAFPIPVHALREDKLENSLSLCYIKLPTGLASAKERLRVCEESYRTLRDSTVPATNIYLRYLVGLLPYKYFKYILRSQPWTGNLSNLPGPFEFMSIADHPIEDVVVASTSDSGFLISFLSYAESIRISIAMDHCLIPANCDGVAKDLLKNMYAELVLLGIEGMV